MKLRTYRYKCGVCGEWYQSGNVELYGEFILRSNSGEMRYLNAISNTVFSEVSDCVERCWSVDGLNDDQRGDVIQKVFSVACDPDANGGEFGIGVKPPCPNGHLDIADWNSPSPPIWMDADVPPVSHSQWGKLSDNEKQTRINDAVERAVKELKRSI